MQHEAVENAQARQHAAGIGRNLQTGPGFLDHRRAFEHRHPPALTRQRKSCRQAADAGARHNRMEVSGCFGSSVGQAAAPVFHSHSAGTEWPCREASKTKRVEQ